MQKHLSILIILIMSSLSGCKAIRSMGYGNPPVYFAYADSVDIIKDQSKIATLISRGNLSIIGYETGNLRSSNDRKHMEVTIIDVLPGTYTLVKSIGGSSTSTQMLGTQRQVTTRSSPISVLQVEGKLEAGEVYWVSVENNKLVIDKDTPRNLRTYTDAATDKEFPAYLKEEIIKSRNNTK